VVAVSFSANENSWAHHVTNKLGRSDSIHI
jgi:hypothetical protein